MLDWCETPVGWQAARFEVRQADPDGWDLLVAGTRRSHHERASAAQAAASRIERLRRRWVGVIQRLGAAAALVGAIALLVAVQLERNPARDAAEVLAANIDSAYAAVEAGTRKSSFYRRLYHRLAIFCFFNGRCFVESNCFCAGSFQIIAKAYVGFFYIR